MSKNTVQNGPALACQGSDPIGWQAVQNPTPEEARWDAMDKLRAALVVRFCGDGQFGLYLAGSPESYVGISGPYARQSDALRWRDQILAEMERALA
jgi:hypothetical protein